SSGIVPLIEKLEDHRVTLRPVLLNSGDRGAIQLLMTHPTARLAVAGHIHGVSKISKAKESVLLETLIKSARVVLMVVSMLFVPPESISHFIPEDFLPYTLGFLIGCVLLYTGRSLAQRRRLQVANLFHVKA